MAEIQAVLFDADHTLFDTERAERLALRAAFASLGLRFRADTLRRYRRINAGLWRLYNQGRIDPRSLARERFVRLLDELGQDPRRAEALDARYLAALSGRGDLLPGARGALRRAGRGRPLALVTNGIDRVQRLRLAAAGLHAAFAVVVTSEAIGHTKPDPRMLHEALRALGVAPSRALYVGDDLRVDGLAARRARVPFCWVDHGRRLPPGTRPPQRRVRSIADFSI